MVTHLLQGFPRADIDVAGLRADRQRIIGENASRQLHHA